MNEDLKRLATAVSQHPEFTGIDEKIEFGARLAPHGLDWRYATQAAPGRRQAVEVFKVLAPEETVWRSGGPTVPSGSKAG